MLIEIEGYIFDVDIDVTFNYHDMFNEKCECKNCRNFYLSFFEKYPNIVLLLNKFGIDIRYPLEIMDFYYNKEKEMSLYEVYYSVKGIIPTNKIVLELENAQVTFSNRKEAYYSNTGMEEPCFIVAITNIFLPWLLDEPMEKDEYVKVPLLEKIRLNLS